MEHEGEEWGTHTDNQDRKRIAGVRAQRVIQNHVLVNGVVCTVVVDDKRRRAVIVVRFEPKVRNRCLEIDGCVE